MKNKNETEPDSFLAVLDIPMWLLNLNEITPDLALIELRIRI
jgi:hypothetical protein